MSENPDMGHPVSVDSPEIRPAPPVAASNSNRTSEGLLTLLPLSSSRARVTAVTEIENRWGAMIVAGEFDCLGKRIARFR